jgi:hypothetical protein
MIPSLVVTEIRSALVEYLASTFALADDEVRDALSAFLEDQADEPSECRSGPCTR